MKSQENKDRLLDKIVAHFTQRIRDGKSPSIQRYKQKYPELSEEIDEILSSVAMIEELKKVDSQSPSTAPHVDSKKLTKIGDYRIVRELGRGGMGIVFEAVHESLGRRVAIKILPEHFAQNPRHLERFRREAQAAANLHHTNIVSVFGIGQHAGNCYYVMEYVDGQNLSDVIREIGNPQSWDSFANRTTCETLRDSSLSTRESIEVPLETNRQEKNLHNRATHYQNNRWLWVANLGSQIADALSHAHHHGILHRDIKPANLMLDSNDTVWVTDFGLVKNSINQTLTRTGDVVGTPQYMAPESFEGKYDPRSETYCLGLTLYELATLKPAFKEKTTHELIHRITSSSPDPITNVCPQIPRDLRTIIEKSIQRDPADRYPSADEMRDDLRAFLNDQPILARRSDPLERAWRWTRRNRLVTSLVAASVILVCLVAITASTGYITTRNALRKLSEENKKLISAEEEIKSKEQIANSNYEQAKAQFDRAELNLALTLEMLDQMFDQIIVKDLAAGTDLEIDGFDDLSEIRTSVNVEDAQFLEHMLGFYERFTEQNADNDNLVRQTADAYRRVANIYQLIGEATKAEPAYAEAIRIYQNLLAQNNAPGKTRTRELTLAIAQTRNDWAALQTNTGRRRESEKSLLDSLKALDTLHTSHADVKYELAKTLYRLAITPLQTVVATSPASTDGRRGESRPPRHPEAGSDSGREARRGPPHPEGRGSRGKGKPEPHNPPRHIQITKRKYAARALLLFEELQGSSPEEPEYRLYHAKTLIQLASNEFENRDKKQDLLRQAKQELEQLKDQHPENPEYQYALGIFFFQQNGQTPDESLLNMVKANRIGKELYEAYPLNIHYRQLYAIASYRLAQQYRQIGENDKANENRRVALSMWSDLSNETDDIRYFYQKTNQQLDLARMFIRQENYTEAKRLLQESIDELQRPETYQLALRHTKRLQRRWPPRLPSYRVLFGETKSPTNPREEEIWVQYRKHLIEHYDLLSQVSQQQGDAEQAAKIKKTGTMIKISDLKKGTFPNKP